MTPVLEGLEEIWGDSEGGEVRLEVMFVEEIGFRSEGEKNEGSVHRLHSGSCTLEKLWASRLEERKSESEEVSRR